MFFHDQASIYCVVYDSSFSVAVFCINCVCTECVSWSCSVVGFQVTVTKDVIVCMQRKGKYNSQHALDLTESFFSLNVIILHSALNHFTISMLNRSIVLYSNISLISVKKTRHFFIHFAGMNSVCIPVHFQLWTVWNGVFTQQLILQSLSPQSPR